MFSEKRGNVLHGVLLIALFSCSAFYIAEFQFIKQLSFSPLIVGIILGMLYANSLRNHLPETWVIFITERDVIGKGLPRYPVERCFLGTGEIFGDGSHILYVNGAYRDETPIGKLMHDFSCTDPANMYYNELAERVRFFKEDKEGISIMCKAMEDMRNESLQQGKKEEKRLTVLRMLEIGKYALEEIAEIAGLPLDEVKKL